MVGFPDGIKANDAARSIRDLQEGLDKLGFQVTLRAGRKLWNKADELEKQDDSALIDTPTSLEIKEAAKELESTLLAEAEGIYVYSVSEKRIDSEKLMKNPGALLSKNIWRSLPVVSARDWFEGCRAIAFDLPTGAAFYLLRCIEGTLRNFYLCIVKKKRLPEDKRMWGPMVQQLRGRKINKPPEELLDTLDTMRINFRNPTIHPKKVYDIEEVQDLFGLCVDALNRMVKTKYWKAPKDSLERIYEKPLKQSKKVR